MRKIRLTQGKVALVDDEDFQYLNQFKWYAQNTKVGFYAARYDCSNGGRKLIYMHRLILGVTERFVFVDHMNKDTLNNIRSNLRIATVSQSNANRRSHLDSVSKYLGVCKVRGCKTWSAHIGINGKQKYIGSFATEKEAAIAYNKDAIIIHGEFANLNAV